MEDFSPLVCVYTTHISGVLYAIFNLRDVGAGGLKGLGTVIAAANRRP